MLKYIIQHEYVLYESTPAFDLFKQTLFRRIKKIDNTDYSNMDVNMENVNYLRRLCREFNCYY
jgi:hypothetical protein